MLSLFAVGALLAPPVASQDTAPSQSAAPAPELSPDAPSKRLDSVIAACEAAGASATARALESDPESVRWILRVRLGLAATLVAWDPCVQAATSQVLRSRASLARDELVAQLFEAPDPLPFPAAMRLLAELGDEGDLAMLLDWAALLAALTPEDDPSSAAADALRESCAVLASHSAADRRAWSRNIERADESLRLAIVRGLADCGSDDALTRLAGELGRGRIGDSLLLMEIARAARRVDRMHLAEVRRSVRALLDGDDSVRREAALCAGALGDEASAERLVDLLADPSEGVRTNAHWALQHLTGRQLPQAPQAWTRWLDAELLWWSDEAPAQLRALTNADGPERVAAARALAAHRFPRHSLAQELAEAAPLDDPGATAIVLAALERLDSQSALAPLLRRHSEARNPSVRGALDRLLAALSNEPPASSASDTASR